MYVFTFWGKFKIIGCYYHFLIMQENFVEKADKLAGYTTLILIFLGIIQIIYGEFISESIALTANGIDCVGDGFVSAVVWIGQCFLKNQLTSVFIMVITKWRILHQEWQLLL